VKEIISKLKNGNKQFITGEVKKTKYCLDSSTAKQTPIAAVLTCSDSRVPVEHIFGVGIGEIFVIRNAGNIVSQSVLASIQYAVEILNVETIIVMGHTDCGALNAITSLHDLNGELKKFIGKLDEELDQCGDHISCVKENIKIQAQKIKDKSFNCTVYEAVYYMEKGTVEFV